MMGAAITSRAPLIGFRAASISLQTRSIVSKSGPNTLTPMSVRTPGREHLDAIDDRLRKNVAPAGHLQHAPHFVVDQVALGAGLPRPEEDGVRKFLVQVCT